MKTGENDSLRGERRTRGLDGGGGGGEDRAVRGSLKHLLWAGVAAAGLALCACATKTELTREPPPKPAKANLETREWFQDAKFGLFINWGVHSLIGEGEDALNNKRMKLDEYEKLAGEFNPGGYDPAGWAALAQISGARYLTVTAKDRDGFAMFETKQTKWDIVDHTPFGRDPMKALAEECKKKDLRLFFAYSQLDWHHPDYYPRGRTGNDTGRANQGKWDRYLNFMDAQIHELLMEYGLVAGIRLDGAWDRPEADWRLGRSYEKIHKTSPGTMIGSNHHHEAAGGEDFQIWDRALPGESVKGTKIAVERGKVPQEVCETVGGSWGYDKSDTAFKPTRDLLQLLIQAAGRNANLLLGVAAGPEGTIAPEAKTRLTEMGRWLARNGESIYGTRGGPILPGEWGASTNKEGKIYLHYLASGAGTLSFDSGIGDIRAAYMFSSGASLDVTLSGDKYVIEIPAVILDPIDTIIVLEVRAGSAN